MYKESKVIIEQDGCSATDDITGQKYSIKGLLIIREKSAEKVIYPPSDRFYRAVIFPGESYPFQLTKDPGNILLL